MPRKSRRSSRRRGAPRSRCAAHLGAIQLPAFLQTAQGKVLTGIGLFLATMFIPRKAKAAIPALSTVKLDLAKLKPIWPTGVPGRISSGFDPQRKHPVTGKIQAHLAIDIAAPERTAVYATEDGIVTESRVAGGYGNRVAVLHPTSGTITTYNHLYTRVVTKGDRVYKGDLIGRVGSTGTSTGNHLHFEIKSASNNTFYNPMNYMKMPSA